MSRLLMDGPASPAWNMAVDEALLRCVSTPVLRLYSWDCPAISLGYFQEWALVPKNRPFVRRYTGGGMVDHARDITYTLVFPRAHPVGQLSLPDSYARAHEGVQRALVAGGISADLASGCGEEDSAACFEKPVKFDVVQGTFKLAGAAQRRTREGMLHQGSILLPDSRINARVRDALPAALSAVLGETWTPSSLTAAETEKALELEKNRYGTSAWNQEK